MASNNEWKFDGDMAYKGNYCIYPVFDDFHGQNMADKDARIVDERKIAKFKKRDGFETKSRFGVMADFKKGKLSTYVAFCDEKKESFQSLAGCYRWILRQIENSGIFFDEKELEELDAMSGYVAGH